MLCALTVRQLKPGTAEEFIKTFAPELRASQEEPAAGEGYHERRAAIDEFVESVGADGIFEVVEERSMS